MFKPSATVLRSPWIFIPMIAIACHLAFSWQGITLNDDGFVLAVSRRLLNGEFPHRDFIFVRPVGSGVLHAPFLAISGEYALWIGRMVVWFQLGAIAWLWPAIAERRLSLRLQASHFVIISIICFTFGVHNFPILPWYTIDGLFLVSLGGYLTLGKTRLSRICGFALAGAAPLCKQNFLLASIFVPFFAGRQRNQAAWCGIAAPLVIYIVIMTLGHGLSDFIHQMTAQTDVIRYGILPLVHIWSTPIGFALGYVGSAMLATKHRTTQALGLMGLLGVPVGIAAVLGAIVGYSYFGMFGVVAGLTIHRLKHTGASSETNLLSFALITAWSAAVSIGYNTPALAGGALFGVLVITTFARTSAHSRWQTYYAYCLVALSIGTFIYARRDRVPFELPAAELTHPLDGIIHGAKGIWTNDKTATLLKDATSAASRANGKPYTFVPGLPAIWIANPDANPLSSDWAFRTELPTDALRKRVEQELLHETGTIVIASEVNHSVIHGFNPIDMNTDPTVNATLRFVREHGLPIDRTAFFSLFSFGSHTR